MPRATFIVGSFLSSHILLAHWSPFPGLGDRSTRLLSPLGPRSFCPIRGLHTIAAFSEKLLTICAKIGTVPQRVLHPVLVLFGVGIFLGLRSATALLGDGNLYLNELPLVVEVGAFRVDRAPVVFWLVGQLYRLLLPFGHSPLFAYQLYSYLAGLLYLLLIWPAAHLFAHRITARILVAAFLLTSGFLQIFCGYVETYALLLPGILLYAMSGYGVLQRRLPLWDSAGILWRVGCIAPILDQPRARQSSF